MIPLTAIITLQELRTKKRTGFVVVTTGVGSDTNEFGYSGIFYLFSPHNASAYTFAQARGVYQFYSNGGAYTAEAYGDTSTAHLIAEDTDAIRFAFSSGNIASGEIVMYGIVNS